MNIPNKCPSCDGKVIITELCCADCNTSMKGAFDLPEFSLLTHEEEYFLKVFLAARGNIKEVERQLGISYPTVKSRLESLLSKLGLGEPGNAIKKRRLEIVERLERGEISAQETIKLLKELEG